MVEILLVLTLLNYGITQIITESTLFKPFRNLFPLKSWLGTFIRCFLCISVWVGFIISTLIYSISYNYLYIYNPIMSIFVDGIILSAASWLLYSLEIKLNN